MAFGKLNIDSKSRLIFPEWTILLFFMPVAIYFRFIGGTWLIQSNSYRESALNLIVLFLVFASWLILKVVFDRKLLITGLEKYLLFFIAILILSTIQSNNPGLSVEIASGIVAIILSIFIFLDLKVRTNFWRRLIDAILLTGVITILFIVLRIGYWLDIYKIGFTDFINHPGYILAILPRLPDLANFNSNVTAAYIVILLPLGLYRAVSAKNSVIKLSMFLCLFIALIILILTKSRGGYIGLVFIFIAYLFVYRKKIISRFESNPIPLIILITCLFVAIVSSGLYIFITRGSLLAESVFGRLEGWRIAGRIILANPVLGSGLGTFGEIFLASRNPEKYSSVILHAHNEALNLMTNLGLAGFGMVVIILLNFSKKVRSCNINFGGEEKAYFVSLAGFMGMGLVDSYLDSNNIVLIVIVLLIGLFPDQCIKSKPLNWKNGSGLLLILIILGFLDGTALWKLYPYDLARNSAFERDWIGADIFLDEAIRRNNNNSYYLYGKAQVVGQKACSSNENFRYSTSLYKKNMVLYDQWGPTHANLAALYGYQGKSKQAEEQILIAITYDLDKSIYYCLLGDYLMQQDRKDDAITAFSHCLVRDAEWINTPYWRTDKNKLLLEDAIVANMGVIEDNFSEDKYLELGKIATIQNKYDLANYYLKRSLEQNPDNSDSQVIYADLLRRTGMIDEAIKVIRSVNKNNPRNSQAWALLSKIYLDVGLLSNSLDAVETSIALHPDPGNFWQSGNILIQLDDIENAISRYYIALGWIENSSVLTQWTARRFPIPEETLVCLPDENTYDGFYDLVWQGLQELCQRGYANETEELLTKITTEMYPGFEENYGKFSCNYQD